jgi:hypothetical protein
MSKMQVDPEMYMKTKDRATICPAQEATFVPDCTPFRTESHVFSRILPKSSASSSVFVQQFVRWRTIPSLES